MLRDDVPTARGNQSRFIIFTAGDTNAIIYLYKDRSFRTNAFQRARQIAVFGEAPQIWLHFYL
jgi:hypothetical protein